MKARRVLAAAVLTCALTGLAACGGDDDDSASTEAAGADSESEPEPESGSKAKKDSKIERYCELSEELDNIEEPAEAETEEELAQTMKDFLSDHKDLIEDITAAAPDEIKADIEKAFDALRRIGEGDMAAASEFDPDKVDAFNEENCS
jgi:hypothetical protein